MPGLFGIVALDGATPEDETRGLFDRMGASLRHYDDERLEALIQPERGLLVGRIGLPHIHNTSWSPRADTPSQTTPSLSLVAGVVHDPPRLEAEPLERVRALRGFFTTLQDDGRRIVIATDRHASLPIYYAVVDRLLLFAPEVKALLEHSKLPDAWDAAALGHFVSSGFLPLDLTLLKSVRRLRGAHALVVESGQWRVTQYWHYRPGARAGTATRRDLEETIGDLVEQSTQRNLGDPDKSVLFLSGGFDSRAILGSALNILGPEKHRLHCVSWGEDRGPDDSDVAVAQRVAAACGVPHAFIQRLSQDYGPRFREVNRLIDSQSEIAVFHPHEYSIMKELRGRGFERVLRGDECFGYSYHVRNVAGAIALAFLRPLRGAANGTQFLLPAAHAEFCDAADVSFRALEAEVQGMAPDDAKDYFYFTVRLQGYLNTASYYKRCLLDQRNVFLDEPILDLLEQVPPAWRLDKNLFCSAVRRRFPQLYSLPMAKRSNLENWAELLANPASPVRAYALEQLRDKDSGIWTWFDRGACLSYLEQAGTAKPRRAGLRSLLVKAFLKLPLWLQRPVQARKAGRPGFRIAPEEMLLRILALKDWQDGRRIAAKTK